MMAAGGGGGCRVDITHCSELLPHKCYAVRICFMCIPEIMFNFTAKSNHRNKSHDFMNHDKSFLIHPTHFSSLRCQLNIILLKMVMKNEWWFSWRCVRRRGKNKIFSDLATKKSSKRTELFHSSASAEFDPLFHSEYNNINSHGIVMWNRQK